MVIRCKGFYFDVDKGARVCTGSEQADEEPTGKTGKATSSSAKKNIKILGRLSRGRGGGLSKVEKVATRTQGTKDLNIDTLSEKSAVVETVNKANAEERTQEQKHKKYDQLLSRAQPKSSHGTKDVKVENVAEKSAGVKDLEWESVKLKERFQEQQEHKSEKCDQLVSPARLKSNHGTRDIYIDSIPRKSPVITGDKGNLKERNGEERTNRFVVSSPQGGGNAKLYAKESLYSRKKNETKRSSTLVLRIRLHCDDCIRIIQKYILQYKGVESVVIDASKDQVSVTGVVEMKELAPYLKDKIRRNVEVVLTTKGGDEEKERSSTLVLRIRLHCDDCIRIIQKYILKYKGVESVVIDASKDQVSVTGVVEMKELVPYLKDKIRRNVEVVPTTKGGDEEIKDKVNTGGLGGDGDYGKKEEQTPLTKNVNQRENHWSLPHPITHSNDGEIHNWNYGTEAYQGYMNQGAAYQRFNQSYAPDIFSDENPNACSIM
ncbi:heavy metal-associated isoprenylated plant protein 6-like [Syzygium oleosum]|uniref:heavy metal-associated isoprenylated plant protein 6-like n=1 Tax=Syzygium oleosum TaxID=219896 RepID=UPI0024BB7353|nr:heavy metal-associated isoprenylated plant protein 6-like [Syzygium oleosum]